MEARTTPSLEFAPVLKPFRILIPFLALVQATFAALALPTALASGFQEGEEGAEALPDERPEVSELIEQLSVHLKKKGKEDEAAVGVLDKLVQEFPKSGPKDRQAIVAAAAGCFDEKRPKELAEGVPDTRVYDAAAVALGTLGPESVRPLIGLLDHKNLKKLLTTRGSLIRSLGKTEHPDGVKPIRELLKDKDVEIVAAAAQALGSYSKAPEEVRKETFEEVLKALMTAKAPMDADPNDLIARDRYHAVAASMITTLGALAGHEERTPEDWQRWWNKNKKEDWGAAQG
jgi:hypothetical protein